MTEEVFGQDYFKGATSNYGDYDKVGTDRFWMPVIESIKKYPNPKSDSVRVLDLGCAYGHLLKRFGQLFSQKGPKVQVYGADISEFALGQVQQRKIDAALVRLDLNDTQSGGIPYKDKSFELVTALDVLEHTKDKSWNFKELHRILADGGLLVTQVPVKDTWAGRIFRKLDKDATHVNVPGQKEFLEALTENGFEVLEKTRFLPFFNDRKIPGIPVVMQVIARKITK